MDKKFRRILLVRDRADKWHLILDRYAEDVLILEEDSGAATDYLELPADCLIVDPDVKDRTGVGIIVSRASRRQLPMLLFLPDDHDLTTDELPVGTVIVTGDSSSVHGEVESFLEGLEPVDYRELALKQPWLMHPFTMSMSELMRANDLDSWHPAQLLADNPVL